ncbi:hypothetical protein J2S17_004340 [Cytobacillus purgationiresistens]|uniref:Uncharacterized protein n=1 Tax=Cytobacillus purgationiresistens TaxID=863449 RepID=A0ABU0APY4_9BACI|nr:hypothetical protein [Cytobacillus purgationiresistens]
MKNPFVTVDEMLLKESLPSDKPSDNDTLILDFKIGD